MRRAFHKDHGYTGENHQGAANQKNERERAAQVQIGRRKKTIDQQTGPNGKKTAKQLLGSQQPTMAVFIHRRGHYLGPGGHHHAVRQP